MKNSIIFSLIGVGLVLAVSCKDTLDTHLFGSFDEETVWSSFTMADAFVAGTYDSALSGTWAGSGTSISWESRTINSVRVDQVGGSIDNYTTENGLSNGSDLGANKAGQLRRCNIIIKRAEESEVLSDSEKKQLIAEAKFLRGMIFYDQARKMGRFLPIREAYSQADTLKAKELKMTASIEDSYKIIVADFEAAINDLPLTAPAGRATRYAAEVVLSEACLQAYAYTGNQTFLTTCINAATDVIGKKTLTSSDKFEGMFNETNEFDPEILFARYYLSANCNSTSFDEVMLVGPNFGGGHTRNSQCPGPEILNFGNWGVHWPSQQMVDQYLVIDDETGEALPWWETSQWKNNVEEKDPSTITTAGQVDSYTCLDGTPRRMPSPQDLSMANVAYPLFTRYSVLKEGCDRDLSQLMYDNRDARLDATIVRDRGIWSGSLFETNLQGNASAGVRDREDGAWYSTATGYYWKKHTPETPESGINNYQNPCKMHYTIARVAEAYLNRAEAYLCLGKYQEAVADFNMTRTTHGNLPPAKFVDGDTAWKDYMRERNCELCDECADTYFSYLRWGKYGGVCNEGRAPGAVIEAFCEPALKISISRDRKSMLIHQMTLINAAQRNFTERRYLFPIAQGFLNTRASYGLDTAQNPGW